LQRGGRPVAKAVKFATAIHSDETEATLPIADVAMPRTQIAMDAAVRLALPPLRFVKRGGFGKDRKSSYARFHGSPSHTDFLPNYYNAYSSESAPARGVVPQPNPRSFAFDGDISKGF
jgi:hypothetical protein